MRLQPLNFKEKLKKIYNRKNRHHTFIFGGGGAGVGGGVGNHIHIEEDELNIKLYQQQLHLYKNLDK